MAEPVAAIFKGIARAVADDHFSEVDIPLLVEYARAADLANRADAALAVDGPIVDGRASPWLAVQEKAVKALVALSARLRICPQSRFDRLKAGTTSRPQSRPWERDELLAAPDSERRPRTGLASFR